MLHAQWDADNTSMESFEKSMRSHLRSDFSGSDGDTSPKTRVEVRKSSAEDAANTLETVGKMQDDLASVRSVKSTHKDDAVRKLARTKMDKVTKEVQPKLEGMGIIDKKKGDDNP